MARRCACGQRQRSSTRGTLAMAAVPIFASDGTYLSRTMFQTNPVDWIERRIDWTGRRSQIVIMLIRLQGAILWT